MRNGKNITINEYGFLFKENGKESVEWEKAAVSESAFDAIVKMIEEGKNAEEQVLTMGFSKGYGTVIRAKSHVGIIRTSDGTTIEILPKINGNALDSETGRNTVRDIFLKMLRTLKDSKYKDFPNVSLKLLDFPVLEIYIFIFLEEVGKLVKKGIKKNYVGREGNLLFLKWKLQPGNNLKRNLVHQERLFVQYDEFVENIPENKLIKSTLVFLNRLSKNETNRRRIREFLFVFDGIEESVDFQADIGSIKNISGLHGHYERTLAWVKIFLEKQSVVGVHGSTVTLSLLYPMEKLFESYVAKKIKACWKFADVKTQDSEHSLVVEHDGGKKFGLRPDIVARFSGRAGECIIMDTKWKILDEHRGSDNYGISHSDMYQLYAYARKYDSEELYLIYPKCETFASPSIAPFYYHGNGNEGGEKTVVLHVINYDLVTDFCCVCDWGAIDGFE